MGERQWRGRGDDGGQRERKREPKQAGTAKNTEIRHALHPAHRMAKKNPAAVTNK